MRWEALAYIALMINQSNRKVNDYIVLVINLSFYFDLEVSFLECGWWMYSIMIDL